MVRLTDLDEYVAKENEKVKQEERESFYEDFVLTGKISEEDFIKYIHKNEKVL